MKRRILLLMMTALLSVGAWATTENVWTGEVRPGWYQGDGDAGECNHFGVVGFTASRKLMRGDYIVVTATTSNQWYNQIKVCQTNNNWAGDALTTISNYDFSSNSSKLYIPVSDAIVSALSSATSPQYTLYFDGYNYTMTSVDVVYNQGKANLFYSESGQGRRYWGGQLLDPALFAVASVGDIVTIDISRVGNDDDPVVVDTQWGENVKIYNKCPMSVWNEDKKINEDPEGLTELTTLKVFTAPTTLSLVLTEELLANAKVNGLSLGGGNYNFTSVDLLYTPTVSIGTTGYATLGYATALDLTGIEAYTAAVSGDKVVLTSVKGKKIPANTGIILKGSEDDAISLPLTTESTDDVTGNELLVSDGTVTGNGSIYVLANKNNVVGFYKLASGKKVLAGKAYLQIPSESPAPEFIGFGDGTTGITMVQGEGFMVNGSDNYYDLQGRRVAQPTKGLYIVNGKKVIIK